MHRLPAQLLTFCAWICLVLPWQYCSSDCQAGLVAPFGHACHSQAAAADVCCAHEGCEGEPDCPAEDCSSVHVLDVLLQIVEGDGAEDLVADMLQSPMARRGYPSVAVPERCRGALQGRGPPVDPGLRERRWVVLLI